MDLWSFNEVAWNGLTWTILGNENSYLLIDGTRVMTGALNMGTNLINNTVTGGSFTAVVIDSDSDNNIIKNNIRFLSCSRTKQNSNHT